MQVLLHRKSNRHSDVTTKEALCLSVIEIYLAKKTIHPSKYLVSDSEKYVQGISPRLKRQKKKKRRTCPMNV